MKSLMLIILIALSGFTKAAMKQPSPVYQRPPTIVSSVSMVPSGKSLSIGNNNPGLMGHSTMPVIPQDLQQPIAEERQAQDVAVMGDGSGGVGPVPSAPQTQVNPAQYQIYYYPNTGPLSNPEAANYQVAAPVNYDSEVTFWEKYHLTDAIVGVFTIAMVAGGGYLLVPNVVKAATRGRSLRELAQDFNSDDAARLAKSVIQAVEKLYELNNAE